MIKEQICNLCGFNRQAMVYEAPPGQAVSLARYSITEARMTAPRRIVKCLNCGLVFASPMHTWQKLSVLYAKMEDELYVKEEESRRLAARALLKKIHSIKRRHKGGKFLDIGCGTGFLLDEAGKSGWDVCGVEVSKWAADYAQNTLGLKVYNTTLERLDLADNSFDIVVLQDVIEHLIDPKAALIQIRRLLKRDGILYINTPDIDSALSSLLKARWWGINFFHLYYFSRKTLSAMLDKAGFKGIRYGSHPRIFSIDYWLNRFKSYNSFFYKVFSSLASIFFLRKRLLSVNLHDNIGVFAQRSRRLEYIHEFEKSQDTSSPKAKKTVIVLPAYNAAETLKVTYDDIPKDMADEIILVDDASIDETVKVAKELNIKVFSHKRNKGYGANQKTCFNKALELGADIIVMLHPDYQYDPRAIPELIGPIERGGADAVFGSRMMKGGALIGGMPLWKHNANILLTALENVVFNTYLTEYHSGFRAYSSEFLNGVRFNENSDGFVFDTEIIAQALMRNYRIEEIPIRTRYFDEASSIRFWPCVIYGFSILALLIKYILHIRGVIRFKQFR